MNTLHLLTTVSLMAATQMLTSCAGPAAGPPAAPARQGPQIQIHSTGQVMSRSIDPGQALADSALQMKRLGQKVEASGKDEFDEWCRVLLKAYRSGEMHARSTTVQMGSRCAVVSRAGIVRQ